MKIKLLTPLFVIFASSIGIYSFAQSPHVIYHETFGTPSGNQKVNTYTGFDHPEVTYFSEGNLTDIRTTHASTVNHYELASGGGNVMINSPEKNLIVTGIDVTNYTDLSFSFALRKGAIASDGSELLVTLYFDSETVTFSPSLPTGSGTANYYWVTIPQSYMRPSNTLGMKFEKLNEGSNPEFRLDDFYLTGIYDEAQPITLTFFGAAQKEGGVLFSWITSMEKEVSHYIIERSGNGRDFFEFHLEMAKNKILGADYEVLVEEASLRDSEFFRLKSVDYSGTYDYSKVVNLRITQQLAWEKVPNFYHSRQMIDLTNLGKGKVFIYDLSGRLIYEKDNHPISLYDFKSQNYLLVFYDEFGKSYSKQMMIMD